jgi:hypothetical protein
MAHSAISSGVRGAPGSAPLIAATTITGVRAVAVVTARDTTLGDHA